ncbi:deleted in malignant brain tumors 1 protein-like, partial [Mya arenaria]|uniref:deleted in malignant brain tumors 1 protein-like n=1 Tax=Mya arenaria TaxID=6604 RepID=UPI0022E94922
MDDYCSSGTIDLTYVDAIRLRLTSHRHYADSMDCTLNVRTLESNKLMLFFKSINIEGDSPGSCSFDYLQVYDVTPSNIYQPDYVSGLYGKICGYHISRKVHTSSGNSVKLQFVSDSSETGKGFDMIITSFHYGLCDSTEFQCSNGRCIDNSLTCNNYNPCGDQS